MDPAPLIVLLVSPAIGSYLALVADRWGTGEGVVLCRSRCDACGAAIAPLDLVPILSYARLGGAARCCGSPIGARLPGAELAALAVAAWALATVPPSLLLPTLGLGWALLALALIDLRLYRLPDAITLPLLLAGLAIAALGLTGPLWLHALGAALGYAVIAGIGWAYLRLRGIDGLGLGDAKLVAAGGAWLGAAALPSVLLIGSLSGLALAAALGAAHGGIGWRTAVPFGPALALGIWITWVHGPVVLA